MVEVAVIMPFFLFLLVGGFSLWEGLHGSVNLTSAARAGALVASNDLRANPAAIGLAATDATAAVNAEEQTNIYHPSGGACPNNCVTVTKINGALSGTTEVVVTVQTTVASALPGLPALNVQARATASYEP